MKNQMSLRKITEKIIKEEMLATNAQDILDEFKKFGVKFKYDPETTVGSFKYAGANIEFRTGSENVYLEITNLFSGAPEEVIPKLKEFLDTCSDYQ